MVLKQDRVSCLYTVTTQSWVGNLQVVALGFSVSMCGWHVGASKPDLNKRLTFMSLSCHENTRQMQLCNQASRQDGRQASSCVGSENDAQRRLYLLTEVSQGDRRRWSLYACLHPPKPDARQPHWSWQESTVNWEVAKHLSFSPNFESSHDHTLSGHPQVEKWISQGASKPKLTNSCLWISESHYK